MLGRTAGLAARWATSSLRRASTTTKKGDGGGCSGGGGGSAKQAAPRSHPPPHLHPALAATPPTPPAPPYTASAWLARSRLAPPGGGEPVGPLPQAALNRLFRARAVRMVAGGGGGGERPRRAAAAAPLPPGARVLVPASALVTAAAAARRPRAYDPEAPPSPANVALGALLARRVLLALPSAPGGGLVVLDKPAGVRVQAGGDGGSGARRGPAASATMDAAARVSLGVPPGRNAGEDGVPRLVHRLDAGASGCLALGTGRPAAAWLAAAFAGPAALESGGGGGGEGGRPVLAPLPAGAPAVTKTYWALVDGRPYGNLPDPTAAALPASVRAGCGWGPVTHVGPLPLAPHSPRGVGAYRAALDDVRGTAPPPARGDRDLVAGGRRPGRVGVAGDAPPDGAQAPAAPGGGGPALRRAGGGG